MSCIYLPLHLNLLQPQLSSYSSTWTPHNSVYYDICPWKLLSFSFITENLREDTREVSIHTLSKGGYWICVAILKPQEDPQKSHKATAVMAKSKYWILALHLKTMIWVAFPFPPSSSFHKNSSNTSSGALAKSHDAVWPPSLALRGFTSNLLK